MLLVYFVDNKLGGVTSLNYNLASNPISGTEQWVIHIEQEEWKMSRANLHYPVDKELHFHYSGDEHSYKTLKRLRKLVPDREGAMVLNYENEMAMLDHFPVKQTTYQLVHDDYNVRLAKKYGHIVDVFICHNTIIYEALKALFPERCSEIFYLPHGVTIPSLFREHQNDQGKLKLLFLGRITSSKGIFDLPVISKYLKESGVEFEWVCIGNGPELDTLKSLWNEPGLITFVSPSTNKEVMDICARQDVFVLPTKFEGSPVSLLETMSAGLVPVITRLPGGITDIVSEDIGFAIEMDNNRAFADAINTLYINRELLKKMSVNCRKKVMSGFDVKVTAQAYHSLFLRYREFYKPKVIQKLKVGARLDHPLIPASVTKLIRKYNKQK